jgi:hypothetical protein
VTALGYSTNNVEINRRFNVAFRVNRAAGAALAAPTVRVSTDGINGTIWNAVEVNPATFISGNPGDQRIEYAITTGTTTALSAATLAFLEWREFGDGEPIRFSMVRTSADNENDLTRVTNYQVWARTVEAAPNFLTGTPVRVQVTTTREPGATLNEWSPVAATAVTHNSITIAPTAVTSSWGNGQIIEYAITRIASDTPPAGLVWQPLPANRTFTRTNPADASTALDHVTDYYIWARTAQNASFFAGTDDTAERSGAIRTLSGITLSRTGLQTIPAGTFNQLDRAGIATTITNRAPGATGTMEVVISGTDANKFEVATTALATGAVVAKNAAGNVDLDNIPLINGTRIFNIRPIRGLDVGTYTATVTVRGQNTRSGNAVYSASFDVTFTVNRGTAAGVPLRDVPMVNFEHRKPDSLTISNVAAITPLGAANPDNQPMEYGITTATAAAPPTNMVWQSGHVFTGLRPSTNYVIWARTAATENSNAGAPRRSVAAPALTAATWATANAAATLPSPHDISLDRVGTHALGTGANISYTTRTTLAVVINNTGSAATGPLTIAITGHNPGSFELLSGTAVANAEPQASPMTFPSIPETTPSSPAPVAANRTFFVRPKLGLDVGVHTATITVSNGTIPIRSFNVTFTVNGRIAGAAVTTAPTVSGTPGVNSITVNPAVLATTPANHNQTVEYHITTLTTAPPATAVWQDGTTFTGLQPATTYFVWARSKANQNCNAGAVTIAANRSLAIRTAQPDYAISLQIGTALLNDRSLHQFTAVAYHASTARAGVGVIVNNIGALATGEMIIEFGGFNPGSFEVATTAAATAVRVTPDDPYTRLSITPTTPTTAAPAPATRTFNIRPVAGIPAGVHQATVTVRGGAGQDAFSASFNVAVHVTKLNGAALRAAPLAADRTSTSLTVTNRDLLEPLNTVTANPGNQVTEYAITRSTATAMNAALDAELVWRVFEDIPVRFEELSHGVPLLPSTTYFIWARTRANTNYNAGAPRRSAAIATEPVDANLLLQNNAGNAILSNPETPVTHTFAAATYHPTSVRTPLVVRVTNTGRLDSGVMNVHIASANPHGTPIDAFEITAPAPASASSPLTSVSLEPLARGANRTFNIRPKAGLDAGTYEATVTVTGMTSVSFNVSFTVTKAAGVALRAVPTVALDDREVQWTGEASLLIRSTTLIGIAPLPANNFGNQDMEIAVTTNPATAMTPALDASLDWQQVPIWMGDPALIGEYGFYDLRPNTNYFIWIRSEANNNCHAGPARRSSAILTPSPEHGINHNIATGLITFASAPFNYTVRPVQTVRITNVSNITNPISFYRNSTGPLNIEIVDENGVPSTDFEIVSPAGGKLPPIAGSGFADITVRPVQGLEGGTHSATVVVWDTAGVPFDPNPFPLSRKASFDVSFTVTRAAGSAVSNAPVAKAVTATSIEVHPVPVTGQNLGKQVVEYAITTTTAAPAANAWVEFPPGEDIVFENRNPLTVYYVHARTQANDNNNAGAILRSGIIQTDTPDYAVSHGRTGAAPHLHTFTAAAHGYAAPATLAVTISNIGKKDTGDLKVEFISTQATDRPGSFVVSTGDELPGIPIHNSRSITVRPVTGLDAGVHTATLRISGSSGPEPEDVFEASFRVTFTVNRVAGAGAVLSGAPTIRDRSYNEIMMNTLTIPINFSNQQIEYAITTNNAATLSAAIDASLDWKTFGSGSVEFDGLVPGTVYYVWARARATANHNAGVALRSAPMQTAS